MGHTKFRWLGWLFSGVFAALVFASACAGGDETSNAPGPKKDGGGTGASGGSGGAGGGTGGSGNVDGGGTGGDGGPCIPGEEVCDGEDNDCDGEIDEGSTNTKTWYEDNDGDGYGVSTGQTQVACSQPVGFAEEVGDCNDNDPAFHPGALETNCDDPNDYNCDGSVGFVDADGDTFPACQECDDNDEDVYPGATEVCDGKDDDCDGSADFAGGEADADGDGVIACAECDDTEPLNFPGNTEKCDGKDNNCNGLADFTGGELDADGDGSYSCLDCDDNDNDNYPGNTEICDGQDNNCNNLADFPGGEGNADGDPAPVCIDCNDNNPNVYPGKAEVCDGVDNDCNATTFASGGENDNDGDSSLACADCNDNDPANFPGNPEKCDGKDNNCNGTVDQSEVPANILCPNAPNSTSSTCNGSSGCGIGSCTTNYYDVNGTYTDGCECQAQPSPVTSGAACGSAINLGTIADVSAAIQTVNGNIPVAGREIWYTFNGTDDADTNGDEYHVDIRFTTNPSNIYRMDVYRGGCPGGSGTQLATGENTTTDWYTDFNQTSSPPGPCPGPLPCGEGNCGPGNQVGKNLCNVNTATFYVRVYSIGAPTCSAYALQLSNGFY